MAAKNAFTGYDKNSHIPELVHRRSAFPSLAFGGIHGSLIMLIRRLDAVALHVPMHYMCCWHQFEMAGKWAMFPRVLPWVKC